MNLSFVESLNWKSNIANKHKCDMLTEEEKSEDYKQDDLRKLTYMKIIFRNE